MFNIFNNARDYLGIAKQYKNSYQNKTKPDESSQIKQSIASIPKTNYTKPAMYKTTQQVQQTLKNNVQGPQRVSNGYVSTYKPMSTPGNNINTPVPRASTPQVKTSLAPNPQDPYQSYFDKVQSMYGEQQKRNEELARQRQSEGEKVARETYDNAINSAKSEIPSVQQGLDKYTQAVREGITNAEADAERQRQQEEVDWGKNQRMLAESRRQMTGQREKQYAALGTIDSYGTGSFTDANQKDDQGFMEQTNENLQSKQNRIYQINSNLSKAKREAEFKIQDKVDEANAKIRAINSAITNNEAQKGQAIRQVYMQAQQEIGQIKDQFEGMKMNIENEKINYNVQQTQKNLDSQQLGSLSQDFISTGRPKTLNDLMFISKNPTGAKVLIESMKNQEGTKASAKDVNIAKTGLNNLDFISQNVSSRKDINPLSSRQYKSAVTNVTDLIGRLRSGGAINADEAKRFRDLLPTYWDSDADSKAKINALKREFSTLLSLPVEMNSDSNNNPLGLEF